MLYQVFTFLPVFVSVKIDTYLTGKWLIPICDDHPLRNDHYFVMAFTALITAALATEPSPPLAPAQAACTNTCTRRTDAPIHYSGAGGSP